MDLTKYFPDFSSELINHLKKIGKEVSFSEGEVVMRPGQYFKNTLIILNGRVKVYREGEDGGEYFLYHLEPGSACALSMICAMREEQSQLKASAETEVRALAIPIHFMDELMAQHRSWYHFVLRTYRERFEGILELLDQVVFHSMDEKLEFYLKRQFASGGDHLRMTHQQIADDLNSSREVISRLLKKLENRGLVTVSRQEIIRKTLVL
jgi:CRP/FNR family transcriptional regulator, anaerobic regulatory protein